jgi:hypothetical protein
VGHSKIWRRIFQGAMIGAAIPLCLDLLLCGLPGALQFGPVTNIGKRPFLFSIPIGLLVGAIWGLVHALREPPEKEAL